MRRKVRKARMLRFGVPEGEEMEGRGVVVVVLLLLARRWGATRCHTSQLAPLCRHSAHELYR